MQSVVEEGQTLVSIVHCVRVGLSSKSFNKEYLSEKNVFFLLAGGIGDPLSENPPPWR